jgi:nicotinate-nucleotide adenylyltransferase
MRLGIFGGTFDPIHVGHLILAEQCREACRLDQVLFVPAGQPPHKSERQITAGRLRLEMVELAIAGHPAFRVSSIELDRAGPSYSADTLAELSRQHPGAELFFLIGSDSLADLPYWYEPARIASSSALVVAARAGVGLPDLSPLRGLLGGAAVDRLREHVVEMPLIEISSSSIRARVAAGHSIRYLVPRAVECFIETHGLYKSREFRAEGSGPEEKGRAR